MTNAGITLLELLVVLTILGVLASITAVGPGVLRAPPVDADSADFVARNRRAAIHAGIPRTKGWPNRIPFEWVTFLPDGQVLTRR